MLWFEGGSVAREGSPERLVGIMMDNPSELNHDVAAVRSGTPHIIACHHICERQLSLNNPQDNIPFRTITKFKECYIPCTQYSATLK